MSTEVDKEAITSESESRCVSSTSCVLIMIINCIWWWGSSPVAMGHLEYSFIAVTQVHSDLKLGTC